MAINVSVEILEKEDQNTKQGPGLESAMKQLKKELAISKVFGEYKVHDGFLTKSQRRRLKDSKSKKRNRKAEARSRGDENKANNPKADKTFRQDLQLDDLSYMEMRQWYDAPVDAEVLAPTFYVSGILERMIDGELCVLASKDKSDWWNPDRKKKWGFPGGMVEAKQGENIWQGMIREYKEETGLIITPEDTILQKTSVFVNRQGQRETHNVNFFRLRLLSGRLHTSEYLAENEDCEVLLLQWMPVRVIWEQLDNSKTKNFMKGNHVQAFMKAYPKPAVTPEPILEGAQKTLLR